MRPSERDTASAGRHQERVRERGRAMFFDWVRIAIVAILFILLVIMLGVAFIVIVPLLLVFFVFLI